ncbi:MAG: DUF4249 domain-containing protein [Maribacter sp.]
MIVFVMICQACIEPYEGVVEGFDDVLVVNTVITNENKQQEVLLKRSYRFEDDGPLPEENATVMVSDDDGNNFMFQEVEPGKYRSVESFAAELNKNYTLSITTQNGRSYASDTMQLPTGSTNIDELYAERITNDNGVDGMGIFVDSFDPTNSSKYYRFDFIETYKVIAPLWNPKDIVYLGESIFGPQFGTILREREEQTCYGTARPTSINLVNTLNLSEDRVTRQNVRFIPSDNYILSHRYSILVKQYVQSPVAFAYYEALNDLIQSSSNVFSEDQPGFLAGNVFSTDNTNEKVAGFFEVATVDEKRIFFNYEEYYPGEELPPYAQDCVIAVRGDSEELKEVILDGSAVFYDSPPTRTTRRACGDCTVLGSNKLPDFWVE